MLHSAPVVLNRFQNSEYRIVGRFADAATANASATRNATLMPLTRMPPMIATAPMTTAVYRATLTSWSGSVLPSLITLAYTSWAKEADAVIVRPATTARIVANATAEISPSRISPPSWKGSSGGAEFALPGAALIAAGPTSAAAPKPSTRVNR